MRRLLPLLPILLTILVVPGGLACRRSTLIPPPNVLAGGSTATGTLVESPGCGHYIVKFILDDPNSTDTSVMVKSWTDPVTNSTIANVFTVKDWIYFQQANVSVGDTFSFTLNGPVPDSSQQYNTCMVVPYNMPSVSNNVTNIQLVK